MQFRIKTSRLLCRVISSLLMLVSSLFCINLGLGASRSGNSIGGHTHPLPPAGWELLRLDGLCLRQHHREHRQLWRRSCAGNRDR